jgi:predicted membrane protein
MRTEKDNWFLFHLSNYILTTVNVFNEGVTKIVLCVPGFIASLSLVLFSPLYYYTNVSFSHALNIGFLGLLSLPLNFLFGLLQVLFCPFAYFVVVYKETKSKKKKKKRKPKNGDGFSIVPKINWNPNVA